MNLDGKLSLFNRIENFVTKTKISGENEEPSSRIRTYMRKGLKPSSPSLKGWYNIDSYFRSYQAKIRKEDQLEKKIDKSTMPVYVEVRIFKFLFSLQENGVFSQDETILALELFTKVKNNSNRKYKRFCQGENKPSECHWQPFTTSLQFLDILVCLLLSRAFIHNSSSLYCITVIEKVVNSSGRIISSEDICQREGEICKMLDFNVDIPLITVYCYILFEMIGEAFIKISRLKFYEACYEMLKMYFLNRYNIMKQMCRNYFSKELISAAIICAVVYQNSENEYTRRISHKMCNKLEKITEIKREEFLKITRKLIEIINGDNLKIN